MHEISPKMSQLISLVRRAGKRALQLRDEGLAISTKGGDPYDFLTNADTELDQMLRDELPAIESLEIVSEEHEDGRVDYDSKKLWIADPIDGTKQYQLGFSGYAVMIGQLDKGVPVLGIIYAPDLETCWFAEAGEGAYRLRDSEDVPEHIMVTSESEIDTARIVKRSTPLRQIPSDDWIESVHKKELLVEQGSIGLRFCKVAEGSADAVFQIFPAFNRYDIVPGQCITEEAGGRVTDISGNRLLHGGMEEQIQKVFAVSNGAIHDEIIIYLHRCAKEAYDREIPTL